MKKIFFIVFIFLFTCVAFSAVVITVNSIGMQGNSGLDNIEFSDDQNITVMINYTVSGLTRGNQIEGCSFGGELKTVLLSFYSSSTPNEGDWEGDIWYDSTIPITSRDGTHTAEWTINVGSSMPLDAKSVQANLSLYTTRRDYSAEYSSYQEDLYYGTSVPLDNPPAGYSSYLTIFRDAETLAPTLYTPGSPAVATYNNSTLLIDFQLTEPAYNNSVKLYFSPNSNGVSPTTTLTLATALENTDRHQIELNPSAFSTASTYIWAVSGETSLTHLNTYYVAIGYRDELENPEAISDWNKLIYDNEALKPTDVSASNDSLGINVHFTLHETSQENGITIYIKNSENLTTLATVEMDGTYSAGNKTITINSCDLANSENITNTTGVSSLESGKPYRFAVKMIDLAGNVNTSTDSDSFFYSTNILATVAECHSNNTLNGYDSGNYQVLGYVCLKTKSGEATLTEISFDLGGTIDVGDAANLVLYSSLNDSFTGADVVSNTKNFTGTGKYSFPLNSNKILTAQKRYYFVAISLNSNGLTYDDYITLSINKSYITSTGLVLDLKNPDINGNIVIAHKYLYKSIIVNYFDSFPNIAPGSPNAPFFRLDLRTNGGVSSITSLTLAVTGTLANTDVVNRGIKLWESDSKTFNQNSAKEIRQLGGGINYSSNSEHTFSGFTNQSQIDSLGMYYFFTVSTKATANTEATIGGDILSSGFIVPTDGTKVNHDTSFTGFPIYGDLQTLPVELSSFTASLTSGNDIEIKWTVESEIALAGYHILRSNSDDLNTAITISVLVHSVNSPQTYTYSYVDDEVDLSFNEYYYWLKTVELSNESEYFGPTVVKIENHQDCDLPPVILETALIGNYPNPFNPSTSISFYLDKPEKVVLDIYNIRGQLVRNLYNENVTETMQRINVVWDGNNNNGTPVASGIYYTKMIAGKHSDFKKMLLMK